MPVKSIIDEPYEEWSARLDFQWLDELEDLAVDNMVRLIEEGFAFRKEMFKGGLTANDLSRLRVGKKLKDKEPREKNVKDHVAEMAEGEAPDSQAHVLIANLVASLLDAKLETILSHATQSQQGNLLQSTISRCLQDIERKIGHALSLQLKNMEAAIIKAVIDVIEQRSGSRRFVPVVNPASENPPVVGTDADLGISTKCINPAVVDLSTPSEAADRRIDDVLRDLDEQTEQQFDVTAPIEPVSL